MDCISELQAKINSSFFKLLCLVFCKWVGLDKENGAFEPEPSPSHSPHLSGSSVWVCFLFLRKHHNENQFRGMKYLFLLNFRVTVYHWESRSHREVLLAVSRLANFLIWLKTTGLGTVPPTVGWDLSLETRLWANLNNLSVKTLFSCDSRQCQVES